jgi:DNA-binding NarL/FixJ family response regulator
LSEMIDSVILAEDNLEQCFFFERALKEVSPKTVFTAVHDGDELMALLEKYLPDLLFLDLGMPCKNGVECIKEIRDDRTYDSMPIVVFSVAADDHAIQAAYGYGANIYLVKPGEYSLLASALRDVFSMDWRDPKRIAEQYFCNNRYVAYTSECL